MKKTLKLVPAFAMLLVSAILVSTSTYAWFTMNTSVTATGMQVKATADSSLLIKVLAAADNTYSSTADIGLSAAAKLLPTSSADLTKFFKATAQAYNVNNPDTATVAQVNADTIDFTKSAGEAGGFTLTNGKGYIVATNTGTDPISGGENAGNSYALVCGYNVKKSEGAATDGLLVKSITVDGYTAALSDSIRVGIVMVNGTTVSPAVIVNPTRTAKVAGTESPYASTSAVATTDPTIYPTNVNTTTREATLDTTTTHLGTIGSAEVKVFVIIYFEGQDFDNHSYNYDSNNPLDELEVSVKFESYSA